MALRIPSEAKDATEWAKEIADECMSTSEERQQIYEKAARYYYTGCWDAKAAIHNKVKTFIDKLAGYYYQPSNVRFNTIFDSTEPMDVLQRGKFLSEKLSADYRATDADLRFGVCVKWALNCGNYFLKHIWDDHAFKCIPVHPVNMGVLSETITNIDEQEAFCHVSYPTATRVNALLQQIEHPQRQQIMQRIMEGPTTEPNEQTYFHNIVVGGLNPLGEVNSQPSAAGIVQVFPIPTPWRPQRKISKTVKLCELWIKDRDTQDDYSCLQLIYPDILIEGEAKHRNISRVPGHHPFVKVQADETPGYFWGLSCIAQVQMLQDTINKRLRDLKVMWDRNAAAPYSFSGFMGVTEESYYKLMSEGGFISDPNPQAKASKLTEPPTPGYLEELEFLWRMFDEAGGFTPIMSGQGEPGVRAGVHAQTLVRTSSPGLIDPATAIERQLADSGYLAARLLQEGDPTMYEAEGAQKFYLKQLPENYRVEVDGHSASPAFAEDSRQVAVALARAQAIDAEDLINMLHPPNAELLLARLRERKAAQAKMEQEMMAKGVQPDQHAGKKR